nr:MAG TPA: hypothetical protein [Caudoviricetes sp.]
MCTNSIRNNFCHVVRSNLLNAGVGYLSAKIPTA